MLQYELICQQAMLSAVCFQIEVHGLPGMLPMVEMELLQLQVVLALIVLVAELSG